MKPLIFALCVVFAFSRLSAQTAGWQPSPGHTQVRIWPDTPPDTQPVKEKEFALSSGTKFLIAGKSATEVRVGSLANAVCNICICHNHPPLTVGALESSPIVEPGAMVHDS